MNQPADFDGNGDTNMDDAIYLLFHVNFPESYPLHWIPRFESFAGGGVLFQKHPINQKTP